MPYRDIQSPIVGDKQIVQIGGQTKLIDLVTYLGYINDNLVMPTSFTPIQVNGVVGEKQTYPAQTTSNTTLAPLGVLLQPIVFPTAGTIQKTVQTPFSGGSVYVLLQCEMVCLTAQASVVGAVGVRVEKQDLVTGAWDVLHDYDAPYWYVANVLATYAANDVYATGYFLIIPNTQPGTNYRVTALGGTLNITGSLPTTASWSIDATGANTFQFMVWTGG